MKQEDLNHKDITSLSNYEKVYWQMSQEPFVVPVEKDVEKHKVVSNKDVVIILLMILPVVVCYLMRRWYERKK